MLTFLHKPYPSVIEDGYRKPNLINLLLSIVVVSFLYIFKPTNLFLTVKIDFNFINCLLFGAITLITSLIFTNVLPELFKKFFHYKTWTIGKEVLYILSLLFTIATLNFFIGWQIFFSNVDFRFSFYFQTLVNTFIIAVFPIFVATSINLITSQQKSALASDRVNTQLNNQNKNLQPNSAEITLNGNGKYEILKVHSNDIIFMESAGNYSDLYYLENGENIKKVTFRSTLQELENQLTDFSNFYRSHRSFIVNINHVSKSSGNAQGYQLTLILIDDKEIPVSRTRISGFNALFSN
jgi:hypothetical protein